MNPLVKEIERAVCRTILPRGFCTFGYVLLRKDQWIILRECDGLYHQHSNEEQRDDVSTWPDGSVLHVKWQQPNHGQGNTH